MKKTSLIILIITVSFFSCTEKLKDTIDIPQPQNIIHIQDESQTQQTIPIDDNIVLSFSPLNENESLYYETFRKEIGGTFNVIFRTDDKNNAIEEIYRHPMIVSNNQYVNSLIKRELFFYMGDRISEMELFLCNGNKGQIVKLPEIYAPFSVSFDKKYVLTLSPERKDQINGDDKFYLILQDFSTRNIFAEKDIFEFAPQTTDGENLRYSTIVDISYEDDFFLLEYYYEIELFTLAFYPETQEVKLLFVNEYHPIIVTEVTE